MEIQEQIKELQLKLKKVEDGKPGNWLGHWAKSLVLKKIKAEISDLEKQLNKQQ